MRAIDRPSARILPACSWSHGRRSWHDPPRRPFTWSRITIGLTISLLEVRTATGSGRARGRTVCFASRGLPVQQPRRKGWKARWKGAVAGRVAGLFSLCRSRVRVVALLSARDDEPHRQMDSRHSQYFKMNFSRRVMLPLFYPAWSRRRLLYFVGKWERMKIRQRGKSNYAEIIALIEISFYC